MEKKARGGQGVNPDKAGSRVRDKVKAAKAVSAEEEKIKDKRFSRKENDYASRRQDRAHGNGR